MITVILTLRAAKRKDLKMRGSFGIGDPSPSARLGMTRPEGIA